MKRLSLFLTATLFSLAVQAQTPIAHYDFSGVSGLPGTIVPDVTGNGHDGTVVGNLTVDDGKCGTPNEALRFSTGNYVQVPSSTAFNIQEWTISAIVYMTAFEKKTCQVSKIVQRGTQYGGDYFCLEVNDNFVDGSCGTFTPSGQQPFGAAAGVISSYTTTPATNLSLGQWYCLTTTYLNDTLKTYIDGVLDHVAYWPNQYLMGPGGYPSTSPLYIGTGVGSGGMQYYFNGLIDEVYLYSTPMNATQVAALCPACPPPCAVSDVQYCSSLSTPFTYTFTPTVVPATNCVQWDFNDGTGIFTSPAGAAITHTFPGGGSYNICATSYDCVTGVLCAQQTCFNMCLDPGTGAKQVPNTKQTGRNQTRSLDQLIGTPYPNPTHSQLNIPVRNVKGEVTISVIGMDGRLILSRKMTAAEGNALLQLNTDELKPGTYLLELSNGDQKASRKFSRL